MHRVPQSQESIQSTVEELNKLLMLKRGLAHDVLTGKVRVQM